MIKKDIFNNILYRKNGSDKEPLYRITDYDGVIVAAVCYNPEQNTGFYTPVYTELWYDLPDFNTVKEALCFIIKHYNAIY